MHFALYDFIIRRVKIGRQQQHVSRHECPVSPVYMCRTTPIGGAASYTRRRYYYTHAWNATHFTYLCDQSTACHCNASADMLIPFYYKTIIALTLPLMPPCQFYTAKNCLINLSHPANFLRFTKVVTSNHHETTVTLFSSYFHSI